MFRSATAYMCLIRLHPDSVCLVVGYATRTACATRTAARIHNTATHCPRDPRDVAQVCTSSQSRRLLARCVPDATVRARLWYVRAVRPCDAAAVVVDLVAVVVVVVVAAVTVLRRANGLCAPASAARVSERATCTCGQYTCPRRGAHQRWQSSREQIGDKQARKWMHDAFRGYWCASHHIGLYTFLANGLTL